MRKVYILRENEEDGAVADALQARGLEPGEDALENPVCPKCGSSTLLAYTEGEDYEVITWFCLFEENEPENPDQWFLVCSQFDCDYEELVERVHQPMDAIIFDLRYAHEEFDEYCNLIGNPPIGQKHLISILRPAVEETGSRKLACFLDEAEWRYEDEMKQVRAWLNSVPMGRRIEIRMADGREVKGAFLCSTETGCMVRAKPEGEIVVLDAEAIYSYFPKQFADPEEEAEKSDDIVRFDSDKLIMIHGFQQRLVIRGCHLDLVWVDRVGMYKVRTWNGAVGRALNLEEEHGIQWTGAFRRSEIECRYDAVPMIKVRGHWLQVWGTGSQTGHPAAHTHDPEVAALLDMKPEYSWFQDDRPLKERDIIHWSRIFSWDEAEDQQEVRTYHWPLPESTEQVAGK